MTPGEVNSQSKVTFEREPRPERKLQHAPGMQRAPCTNSYEEGGHLETWPEHEVDAIQVAVQTGHPAAVHDELLAVIDADQQQQSHQVVALLYQCMDSGSAELCEDVPRGVQQYSKWSTVFG